MNYEYLDTNDGANSTSSTDANDKTVYTLDATESWSTEAVGISQTPAEYGIIGDSITGTGALTLQHSFDGVNWFNTQNSGSDVTITLDSSFTNETVIDLVLAGNKARWTCDGSATGGTVKIMKVNQ